MKMRVLKASTNRNNSKTVKSYLQLTFPVSAASSPIHGQDRGSYPPHFGAFSGHPTKDRGSPQVSPMNGSEGGTMRNLIA